MMKEASVVIGMVCSRHGVSGIKLDKLMHLVMIIGWRHKFRVWWICILCNNSSVHKVMVRFSDQS